MLLPLHLLPGLVLITLLPWVQGPGVAQAQESASPVAAQQASVEERSVEPVPLVVWNREVAVLRVDLGSLTASERARHARERILALPDESPEPSIEVEEIRLGSLAGFNLLVGGTVVFTLFEGDLDAALGETLPEAAERARVHLREVLRARVQLRSLPLFLRAVGLALAATIGLLIALWLIALIKRAAVKRGRARVARSERLRVRDIDLRPYAAEAFERAIGIVNLVLVGVVLYLWLEFCLARFPYTLPWSEALSSQLWVFARWTLGGIVEAVPGLFIVMFAFFVTRGIARTISLAITRIERRAERTEGVAPETVRATRRLAVAVVWIFGIVFAYPHMPGAQSDAFKGVSVLLGLMITLGSSGLVNQIMSGLVVLYSKAVRGGEVVRIGEVEGQVTDLGLLSTRVLVPSGEEVSIPNALVVTHEITNYSRGPGNGRAVASTSVTIGYDTPWRQVRALLLLAAQRTKEIARDPAPRVTQVRLADWYAEYRLIFEVEDGKRRTAVLTDVHAAIQDTFNEYGVQVMSPHFVAQPDGPVVVPLGREEPEPAPRFRFTKEAPPASFDPVEKAAQERAEREAEEQAKAERARAREERELAEKEEKKAKAREAEKAQTEPSGEDAEGERSPENPEDSESPHPAS